MSIVSPQTGGPLAGVLEPVGEWAGPGGHLPARERLPGPAHVPGRPQPHGR